MNAPLFNEDSLRTAIASVWGEYGAHMDVFDQMLRRCDAADRAEQPLADLTASGVPVTEGGGEK